MNTTRNIAADFRSYAEYPVKGTEFVPIHQSTLRQAAEEIERLRASLKQCHGALEQAQDCIRGETPEDCSVEDALEDTVQRIREALGLWS